jgi:aryl-alcohol dehydrogenase-like predicted oxidoreductase
MAARSVGASWRYSLYHPTFSERKSSEKNLNLVERIRLIALGHSASISQIAIAWSLSKGDDIFSLIGARRLEQVYDALGALEISLSS